MSEMRFNPVTRHWVIISQAREERPNDFSKPDETPLRNTDPRREDCPFCPGNEAQTTEEISRIDDDAGDWLIRTVYNKFPALRPEPEMHQHAKGTFLSMRAAGQHEVVIEHPRHDMTPAESGAAHLRQLIRVYRERYAALRAMEHIQNITLFRNHGERAGTSLEHPHSQIIAAPIVPPQVRYRLRDAEQFHHETGDCLFCCVLEDELDSAERLIELSTHFVAFVPFAALSPFHQWIFPRRHAASFDSLSEEEIDDLARILNRVLLRIREGVGDPDFNLSIRSAPTNAADAPFYHWYIALVPRVNRLAGFELGTGMHINPLLPERAAEQLRAVEVL